MDKQVFYKWLDTMPYHGLGSRQLNEYIKGNDQTVANELAWIDYVEEEFIQKMLTYPDAEAILNKITKENRND